MHSSLALELTVLHATERGTPSGRDPIEWELITNLPVTSRAQAIEKLQWYGLRWRIEIFYKILKSGCQAFLSLSLSNPNYAAPSATALRDSLRAENLTPNFARARPTAQVADSF